MVVSEGGDHYGCEHNGRWLGVSRWIGSDIDACGLTGSQGIAGIGWGRALNTFSPVPEYPDMPASGGLCLHSCYKIGILNIFVRESPVRHQELAISPASAVTRGSGTVTMVRNSRWVR